MDTTNGTPVQDNTAAPADTSAQITGQPAAQEQQQAAAQTAAEPAGTIAGSAGAAAQQPADTTAAPTDNSAVTYDFSGSIPEGFTADAKATEEFSEIAHGLNLNNDQANQLAAYGMQYAQRTMDAMQAAQEAQYQAWADESREKLGANFDKTVALAGTAIEKLEPAIPNIRQVLNQNGMGNRIEVIQLLAKFGEMVSEDTGNALSAKSGSDPIANRYGNTDFSRYK